MARRISHMCELVAAIFPGLFDDLFGLLLIDSPTGDPLDTLNTRMANAPDATGFRIPRPNSRLNPMKLPRSSLVKSPSIDKAIEATLLSLPTLLSMELQSPQSLAITRAHMLARPVVSPHSRMLSNRLGIPSHLQMYVGFMDPQAAESPAMHMTSSFQSPRPTMRKMPKLEHTTNQQTTNGGMDTTESPP